MCGGENHVIHLLILMQEPFWCFSWQADSFSSHKFKNLIKEKVSNSIFFKCRVLSILGKYVWWLFFSLNIFRFVVHCQQQTCILIYFSLKNLNVSTLAETTGSDFQRESDILNLSPFSCYVASWEYSSLMKTIKTISEMF